MFYLYTIFTKAYCYRVANKYLRTLKRVQCCISMALVFFWFSCECDRMWSSWSVSILSSSSVCITTLVSFSSPFKCSFPGSRHFWLPSPSIDVAFEDYKMSVNRVNRFLNRIFFTTFVGFVKRVCVIEGYNWTKLTQKVTNSWPIWNWAKFLLKGKKR